jgi:hypothetical protein
LALVTISILAPDVRGQDDLFSRNKSDSTIKMLVFPLSMAVVENRPHKGLYYFFGDETREVNKELKGNPESLKNPLYSILSDAKIIKKTLVKTDPTRVAPSKHHEDFLGPVTKAELKLLSAKYKKDLVLVFRREIYLPPEKNLPESLNLNSGELFNLKSPIKIKIKNVALLYLSKQNKILMIPPNEQTGTITHGDKGKSFLRDLNITGLKQLTKQSKKIIRDNQFTIRRSNY